MSKITKVFAREIFDSRGNPTVEVDLYTDKGVFRSCVPSGASTGTHEAVELRDGDKTRFLGKGVLKAVGNVNNIIAPKIIGMDVCEQKKIDETMMELDGTENKGKLGANAILGVSMACCRAAAAYKKQPLWRYIADLAGKTEVTLPVPLFNVINGGSHAGNNLAMQEFMIAPTGAKDFHEAMRMGAETFQHLKSVIKNKYGQDATNVGDEGGFAPNILTSKEGLQLIKDAIEKAGYTGKIEIAMDCAASEFYDEKTKKYDLGKKLPNDKKDPSLCITPDQLIELYKEFGKEFPVALIEDPFAEDDWETWIKFTEQCGDKFQIVGDDLCVTNPKRIQMCIDRKACNSVLIKLNQIGSVSEVVEACRLATQNGFSLFVSHRSGETEDSFIADMVVGLDARQIKTGAPCRSERLCKYNQLMRIEEELQAEKKTKYEGRIYRKSIHG